MPGRRSATIRTVLCAASLASGFRSMRFGHLCNAKAKNVPMAKAPPAGAGDCWTWMAIDADTKLIPSFFVGSRDAYAAQAFIGDLASRIKGRMQLTSDGHKPYLEAVEQSFGADIDYAMLVKIYGD